MDHCHNGDLQGIEHQRQTICNQYSKRHLWQGSDQCIALDTGPACPHSLSIDDTHLVAMYLADGTQRHSIQAHGLQYLLTVHQHFVVYTAVEAEIELLARTPGVAGRKGAA
jgi:hypothetical protein